MIQNHAINSAQRVVFNLLSS